MIEVEIIKSDNKGIRERDLYSRKLKVVTSTIRKTSNITTEIIML
jgi:hypothetical protein